MAARAALPVKAMKVLAARSAVLARSSTLTRRSFETMTVDTMFDAPQLPLSLGQLCLDRLLHANDAIAVGGHRGMGMNWNVEPAPYRENTIRSFQQAAAAGASFVEFDVQVTRDGVPVVWHDDDIVFGRPGSPQAVKIADVAAEEFCLLGQLAASRSALLPGVLRRFWDARTQQQHESHSAWHSHDDDGFPTLEDVFKNVPEHVGFNIEVKMATPDDLARTPDEEIERMVRPILEVVAACSAGSERPIVFSSFDPDVCAALRQRQEAHPVMFLSTGGSCAHADPRRMSIAAAIETAVALRLGGVVVDGVVLQREQHHVAAARALGLRVLTYGLINSQAEWVLVQQALGVHAAIVDDVPGLLAGLGYSQQSVQLASGAAEPLVADGLIPARYQDGQEMIN